MEKAQKEGKVKSIGLSNFYWEQLDDIFTKYTVKPAVNQVEAHPYFEQRGLIKKNGIIWYWSWSLVSFRTCG